VNANEPFGSDKDPAKIRTARNAPRGQIDRQASRAARKTWKSGKNSINAVLQKAYAS
jgi:hypothetical protein